MTAADRPPEVTIHPAKLPLRLPPESLHVRPDADGVVATDPDRSGWRYLSFRAFGLTEGESVLLDRPDQEAAIVTISGGGVEIVFDHGPSLDLAGRPSVFVYDGHAGGIGIAERGFEEFEGWVADTAKLLRGCPCADGCPSCVQSPKCGNLNDMLDKAGALKFLRRAVDFAGARSS